MTQICVLVLMGLPGCGKTTFARFLQTVLNGTNQHCRVKQTGPGYTEHVLCVNVCYDSVIPDNLHGDILTNCKSESWKHRRLDVLHCVELLLDEFTNTSSNPSRARNIEKGIYDRFSEHIYPFRTTTSPPQGNIVIIIDDNMYYSSMRYEYYQIAREYSVGFGEVYIECSEIEAHLNNAQREKKVKDEVISRMAQKMEAPGSENWEKFAITVKNRSVTEEMIIHKVLDLIAQMWANPVQKVEVCDPAVLLASRQSCSKSLIHQVDLILRQLVGKHMKELQRDKKNGKIVAKCMIEVKAAILKEVETGKVTIKLSDEDIENAARSPASDLYNVISSMFDTHLESVHSGD